MGILINLAEPEESDELFRIMTAATSIGSASHYPPEIISAWHKGRTSTGMTKMILGGERIYSLKDDGLLRGFIHLQEDRIIGLFVDPAHHGKGFGTLLCRFAILEMKDRPIRIKSTLNAIGFYEKLGFVKCGMSSVRRHSHDIYYMHMELR